MFFAMAIFYGAMDWTTRSFRYWCCTFTSSTLFFYRNQ